jgi:hypothetical protein
MEVFANLVDTTLAANYTAGAASITVASATGLPSTGTFSVRLGNTQKTILICSARSGTTLTVTAEANDANATSGDTVTAVILSARTMGQLMQEPATDSPYIVTPSYSRGLAQRLYPIDPAQFSWTNQGSATETTTNGFAYLEIPSSATNSLRIRRKAQPATPYVITVGFLALVVNFSFFDAGICFRESATSKLEVLRLASAAASTSIYLTTASSETALVSNIYTLGIMGNGGFGQLMWFRMANDGTNLTMSYSVNGYNFTAIGAARAKNAYFTTAPDQVGYFCNTSASAPYSASFYSWRET